VITQPIPEEMPPQYRNKVLKRRMVEGVGEPTTACFLNQAVDTDPTNWYLIPPDNICLVQMLEDKVAV